jgi:hypothetical protein
LLDEDRSGRIKIFSTFNYVKKLTGSKDALDLEFPDAKILTSVRCEGNQCCIKSNDWDRVMWDWIRGRRDDCRSGFRGALISHDQEAKEITRKKIKE